MIELIVKIKEALKEEVDVKQQLEVAGDNVITYFSKTFLSNFYTADVMQDGVLYPSVEHAYQAAKFSPDVFMNLDEDQWESIKERLRTRGCGVVIERTDPIFTMRTIPSNVIKGISVILGDYDLVREGWSSMRLDTMIPLLIQKYQDPRLRTLLLETGDALLVEGNDWGDVLWGYSGGEGKNHLGRALMMIRDPF